MKLVNIFGSPGSGKSTTSAGLFSLMKLKKMNVELVTEVAKDFVWEQRKQCLLDQFYVSALQNHRLERLRDKVDWAITDSPLLLSLIYAPCGYYKNFKPMMLEVFNSYDSVCIYLNRVKPYSCIGRMQNEKESDEIGLMIKEKLIDYKVDFIEIDGDEDAPKKIYEKIIKLGC